MTNPELVEQVAEAIASQMADYNSNEEIALAVIPFFEAHYAARIAELEAALTKIIFLDHHNMGPEAKATTIARAALNRSTDHDAG